MKIKDFRKIIPLVMLVCILVGLYGQFLWSPIIFDDLPFFMVDAYGAQPVDKYVFSWLEIRSLPYATLAWTKLYFGLNLNNFRLGNLILHIAATLSLYGFLHGLLRAVYIPKKLTSLRPREAAWIGAVFFGMHPIATYAVGYLVQRTIVMATLFALLSMWAYVKGSIEDKSYLLWLCVPLYYFSVFSKEHAIMLPPILLLLTALLHADWRKKLRERWVLFTMMGIIAMVVIAARKGILGSAYEIEAPSMLGADVGSMAYPLSIITQCKLFFKYVFLWLVPNIQWMSIDMRERFVRSIFSFDLLYVIGYLAWGGVALRLLLLRGNKGIVGFGMLFPWIFYTSELASIRIQEPFVLYRSYLWASGSVLLLPIGLNNVAKKTIALVFTAVIATFLIFSMERLVTLSDPVLLWNDAKKLVEDKPDILGADRIYYNLGRQLLLDHMLNESEANLKKALEIDPSFAQAHAVLGAVYIERHAWTSAISEYTTARNINHQRNEPPSTTYLMGRAKAYVGAGQSDLAAADYAEACRINLNLCKVLRDSGNLPILP